MKFSFITYLLLADGTREADTTSDGIVHAADPRAAAEKVMRKHTDFHAGWFEGMDEPVYTRVQDGKFKCEVDGLVQIIELVAH